MKIKEGTNLFLDSARLNAIFEQTSADDIKRLLIQFIKASKSPEIKRLLYQCPNCHDLFEVQNFDNGQRVIPLKKRSYEQLSQMLIDKICENEVLRLDLFDNCKRRTAWCKNANSCKKCIYTR